ncbi:MAG: DUF4843 domain-containing protein [Bacteroidales bacterium]
MKRNKISLIISFALAALAAIPSCKVQEVDVFSAKESYVYFKRYIKNKEGKNVRVDTSMMSFSHHYGVTEFTQDYYLGLVGQVPEKDLTYEVQIVEDGTTATPDQYSLPEKFVFRKGRLEEVFPITVYKNKIKEGDEKVLKLRLVDSDDLKVAFNNPTDSYTDIQFRFNNKISKPLWWDKNITGAFFGEYSYKKYETIIKANPGFTTIEGLSSAEIRMVALNAKDYIEKNGITEDDGKEMEIPIY